MSSMLMDKKKNPAALMIVSQMSADYEEEMGEKTEEEPSDMLELAAYRMADAANLHISDMKAFVEAFKMFHHYLHDEEMGEDPWQTS